MVKRIAAIVVVLMVALAPTAAAETVREKCRDSVWRNSHWDQCRQFYGSDPFQPIPPGGNPSGGLIGDIIGAIGDALGGLTGGIL